MGTLKVGALDFNEIGIFDEFSAAVAKIASRPESYFPLQFKRSYYFAVPGSQLPREAGWYIILQDTQPLYVGKTANLDKRLNTNEGSTDDFGNQKRRHDLERNFIKKFIEIEAIGTPRICIIRKSELSSILGVSEQCFTETDNGNVEKVLNLIRNGIPFI